jgi:hypothetical protein
MIKKVTFFLIITGVLLHLYTWLYRIPSQSYKFEFSSFQMQTMLLACAPYIICLFLIFKKKIILVVMFGVSLPLALDLLLHFIVFIYDYSTDSAFWFIFYMPMINILIFLPLGIIIGIGMRKFFFKTQI